MIDLNRSKKVKRLCAHTAFFENFAKQGFFRRFLWLQVPAWDAKPPLIDMDNEHLATKNTETIGCSNRLRIRLGMRHPRKQHATRRPVSHRFYKVGLSHRTILPPQRLRSTSPIAGKTTFLRTMGVNVILAQTVSTCAASSYRGSFFRVISQINEKDDLNEGKSYYFSQAEHLLKMVRYSERSGSTLCLIDEPLTGTNSSERVAASIEILRYMAAHNALVIMATHDLQLARELEPAFTSYHFTGEVHDQGLDFDYQLKRGITTTGNAIQLLRYLGYPETVVRDASARILKERHPSSEPDGLEGQGQPQ